MRFMVRDPNDILAPGVILKEYGEILAVPGEYERVEINNHLYRVMEDGVYWTFVHDGLFITVQVITEHDYQESLYARQSRSYQGIGPDSTDGAADLG